MLKLILWCAFTTLVASQKPCCVPDQFEALMMVDMGTVFIDQNRPNTAMAVFNGTWKIVYDYTNQRQYLQMNITEYSPLIPKPATQSTTVISVYGNHISYQIQDGKCEHQSTDDMTQQCVPDTATYLGQANLGGNAIVTQKFWYQLPDQGLTVTAYVGMEGCLPTKIEAFFGSVNQDSGTFYTVPFVNFVPAIRNPKIFDIPDICNQNAASTKMQRPRNLPKPVLFKEL